MSDDEPMELQRDRTDLAGLADRVFRLERDRGEITKRIDGESQRQTVSETNSKALEKVVDRIVAGLESEGKIREFYEKSVESRFAFLEKEMREGDVELRAVMTDYIKEAREDRRAMTEFIRRIWLLLIGLAFSSTAGFIATYFWRGAGVSGP